MMQPEMIVDPLETMLRDEYAQAAADPHKLYELQLRHLGAIREAQQARADLQQAQAELGLLRRQYDVLSAQYLRARGMC